MDLCWIITRARKWHTRGGNYQKCCCEPSGLHAAINRNSRRMRSSCFAQSKGSLPDRRSVGIPGFRGMELIQNTDLRDALAAERTFLAWIRAGLALMGFGCGPLWSVPGAVHGGSARALSVVLWCVHLVWGRVDNSRSARLRPRSMASYSSCPRVKSRKRSAFPSIPTSCGNSAIPGLGRIDDANLPSFRAGLEQCPCAR